MNRQTWLRQPWSIRLRASSDLVLQAAWKRRAYAGTVVSVVPTELELSETLPWLHQRNKRKHFREMNRTISK
jgi:hypothetical protein